MTDPRFEGKVVIITGANHGIGASTAKAFAIQGANVLITYYRQPCNFTQADLEKAKIGWLGSDRARRLSN